MKKNVILRWFMWLVPVVLTLVSPARALAHCDGLDGPVVKAAQIALDTRNPALVLIWVQQKDEPEIRAAFERSLWLSVRFLDHV